VALNKLQPLAGAEIVEFGAGTGRITVQLLPLARRVWAFDITPAMIEIAHQKLRRLDRSKGFIAAGDSREMPLLSGCAEVAIAGWSLAQIATWHWDQWREEYGRAVDEMIRVVRPGGKVLIIETLGTGTTDPKPSKENLKIVYNYLEEERGFASTWIRTDLRFSTKKEAREIVASIFGDEALEAAIETEDGVILPECTGIWWYQV
jgi:ubiquinone/menaquinone biosynthesis C-methylase UbiE